MTTKSGTNSFHGAAYEYFRNRSLNANTFFNNRAGVQRPAFSQNQYGATLGGPIRKDKTFFFGSYEGFNLRQGQSYVFSVPTDPMRGGDFSNFRNGAGAMIPLADVVRMARGRSSQAPSSCPRKRAGKNPCP